MSEIGEAVAGTIGDLFGDQTEDAPVEEAAVQETEVVAESTLPDWSAASRDLFQDDEEEEPDFSVDDEVSFNEPEDLSPNEYDDEQTQKLKRQLLAERKKAEHYQRQHLTSARKAWEMDVRKQDWGQFLPEDLSTIKATSHRDFLKQSKAIAKSNYTVLKPHFDALQAERTRLTELARTEAQQEVRDAWGRPTVGSGLVAPTTNQSQTDIDQKTEAALGEARRNRSMVGAVKAMIDGGLV